MTESDDRLSRGADAWSESGESPSVWRSVFASVPRAAFIPDTVWRADGDDLVPLRRADDPDAWSELVRAPSPVITQVDDGTPVGAGGRGREITSSASQPDVVALLLRELRVEPGMTVCEIGTGTGYNAALLSARLGPDQVTSIEIDAGVAAAAREALAASGFHPNVVTGDGARGYAPRAPYDRVIATAAVNHVPYAWIEQTRPGGRVLTPWATNYHNGALLALEVGGDGTASGRFVGNVAFMWLRAQRSGIASVDRDVYNRDAAVLGETDIHPYHLVGDYDASLAIGIAVPSCTNIHVPAEDGSGAYTVWFIDRDSRSWASLDYRPAAETYRVRQYGARRLFDEVAAAYRWWDTHGRPGRARWRITVTPDGQRVRLDTCSP